MSAKEADKQVEKMAAQAMACIQKGGEGWRLSLTGVDKVLSGSAHLNEKFLGGMNGSTSTIGFEEQEQEATDEAFRSEELVSCVVRASQERSEVV